ncbi:MAG TPA: DUF2007 domain-containing protein [Verrucomicrobiae bacterium]|nr:DUF2007 domain-containing protein [Verrucomicrobiae bacterium]
MKKCPYCGAEYADDTLMCPVDHTSFERPRESPTTPSPAASNRPEFDFPPLSPEDQMKDLVTAVTCRTLAEADLIVSRLRAAGIEAFLPDECLMQTIGWSFNTYGFVRVQISPKDYDAARELLGG